MPEGGDRGSQGTSEEEGLLQREVEVRASWHSTLCGVWKGEVEVRGIWGRGGRGGRWAGEAAARRGWRREKAALLGVLLGLWLGAGAPGKGGAWPRGWIWAAEGEAADLRVGQGWGERGPRQAEES